jgi:hypothetical protein
MSPVGSWVFGAGEGGGGHKSSVTELVWGNGVNSLCRGGAAGRGGGQLNLSLSASSPAAEERVAFYPQALPIQQRWAVRK